MQVSDFWVEFFPQTTASTLQIDTSYYKWVFYWPGDLTLSDEYNEKSGKQQKQLSSDSRRRIGIILTYHIWVSYPDFFIKWCEQSWQGAWGRWGPRNVCISTDEINQGLVALRLINKERQEVRFLLSGTKSNFLPRHSWGVSELQGDQTIYAGFSFKPLPPFYFPVPRKRKKPQDLLPSNLTSSPKISQLSMEM